MENMYDERVTSQCSVLSREKAFREMGALFDSKSGLVLGFNLGSEKTPSTIC